MICWTSASRDSARLRKERKNAAHLWVRQSIRHVQAGLLSLDQTRASEHLQMVRGRRDALAGLVGERFDGPRALRQEVEELETARDWPWPGRCGRSARRPKSSREGGRLLYCGIGGVGHNSNNQTYLLFEYALSLSLLSSRTALAESGPGAPARHRKRKKPRARHLAGSRPTCRMKPAVDNARPISSSSDRSDTLSLETRPACVQGHQLPAPRRPPRLSTRWSSRATAPRSLQKYTAWVARIRSKCAGG